MPAPHVRPETAAHRRAIYHEAIAMLASGYGADITIDRVARSLATSRRQLQRAFEETGGTTFSAHLTAVRMRHAALLLTQSSITVAHVAQRVGYRDPSQFRKSFKARYGMTPAALRLRTRTCPSPDRQAGETLRRAS